MSMRGSLSQNRAATIPKQIGMSGWILRPTTGNPVSTAMRGRTHLNEVNIIITIS